MNTIKYYALVGIHFLKNALQGWLEYPFNLAGWLLANPIQFLLGFATIKFVVEQFGTLNGWDFRQLAFLYGLSVISHGLSIMLFIQTWYLGSFVLSGNFDLFLLRPMNVLFQFLFMDFNLIGITDLIPGIIVFVYGCLQVQFSWTLFNTLAVLGVVFGATLIRGAVFIISGATSFWTKSNNRFSQLSTNLFDRTTMYPLTMYPLTMYPRAIQIIFTFLLPFGFISFYPASGLLNLPNGFAFSSHIIWATPLVGIVLFVLACLVFLAGVKKYDSSGT